jgi:hypothetical protein
MWEICTTLNEDFQRFSRATDRSLPKQTFLFPYVLQTEISLASAVKTWVLLDHTTYVSKLLLAHTLYL